MYDFQEFLVSVSDKSHSEIHHAAEKEYNFLNRQLTNKKERDLANQNGMYSYMTKLKGLMFFLINHAKPDSLNNYEFQLLKPIVQKLIDKKEYKPEAIKIFE